MTVFGSAVEQKPLDVRGAEDTAPPMRHVRSFDPAKKLCGAPSDPTLPVVWGAAECVVCVSIWLGMPRDQQRALVIFWGGVA